MEKKLAHQLRDVTEATARLYGNDLQIAERLLSHLLTFETQQSGFGLTATQDAYFNEVRKTSCLVCTQETLTGEPTYGHICQQRKNLFTEKWMILVWMWERAQVRGEVDLYGDDTEQIVK